MKNMAFTLDRSRGTVPQARTPHPPPFLLHLSSSCSTASRQCALWALPWPSLGVLISQRLEHLSHQETTLWRHESASLFWGLEGGILYFFGRQEGCLWPEAMSVRSQGSLVRLLVMPLRPLLLRLPGTLQKTKDEYRKDRPL